MTAADPDVADLLRNAIEGLRQRAGTVFLLIAVSGVAAWLVNTDRLADAGRLVGFIDHHDTTMSPAAATLYAQTVQHVDAHQDAPGWRDEGASMTLDEAIDWCLELLAR